MHASQPLQRPANRSRGGTSGSMPMARVLATDSAPLVPGSAVPRARVCYAAGDSPRGRDMHGSNASRFRLRLLLAGVFALAVACGGGGGGSTVEPPKTYVLIASGLMANT